MNNNPLLNKKIFLAVIISFFLLLIFSRGLFFVNKEKKTKKVISPTVTSTIISSKKGFLELKAKTDLTRFSVGQPIVLQVIADSAGEEIVGFDVVLTYEANAFNFTKVTSLLPDFKVYPFLREGYLVLTLVKSLESTMPSIFQKTPVVAIEFNPKKEGIFIFSLKEKLGKETTGFMNNKTERIVPVLTDLKIEIK